MDLKERIQRWVEKAKKAAGLIPGLGALLSELGAILIEMNSGK